MAQLTRITFWNDYFRPHFDIVPVTMYQQGRRNAERSLLLFVQQHRPSAGTLEPHHPRQRESVQELAQRHVPAAGPGTTLGRRLPRARQRFRQRGHLLARHRRKFTVRRHLLYQSQRDSQRLRISSFPTNIKNYPTFHAQSEILYCASFQINDDNNPRSTRCSLTSVHNFSEQRRFQSFFRLSTTFLFFDTHCNNREVTSDCSSHRHCFHLGR